jgi:hypothetical protein
MLGKTVGKYRFVERLGRGGMGTVYKAVDETLDREVAIKVLNAELGDSDVMKRFRAEAVTLARLNHPGIATLFELYRDRDDLLMVMEYVRGETVHDLCERVGPLAPPQAAHLAMQVLDGLSHAHRAGVVHRDLKPANVMITDTGSVKVMDFGIARVLGTERFTQGGYMMGTPAYMAPEQVLGGEVDGRADLYAVGVLLYRLLSGQLPFSADTAIAMVQKQVNELPTPITEFQPDLPSWCARVLERALAKSPSDRFQNADEFRIALLAAVQPQTLGELPTVSTPTPPSLFQSADLTRTHRPTDVTSAQSATERARTAAAVATPLSAPIPVTRAEPSAPMVTPTASRSIEHTTTTVVLGRNHLFALGAIVIVLVLGIAAVAFYATRRGRFPQDLNIGAVPAEQTAVTPPGSTPPSPIDPAASVTPPAPPPPPPPAGKADAGATPPTGNALPSQPKPSTTATTLGPDGKPLPAAPGVTSGRGARGATPPGPTTATATPPAPTGTPPAEPDATLPPMTFKDVRLLVTNQGRTSELNGVLSVGEGRVAVLDKSGGTPLMSVPYSALTGSAYSRSKQPKWKDADGKEIVSKVDLGPLGFFKSERNWVILFSHADPIILRVNDGSLRPVISALEERAGVKTRR